MLVAADGSIPLGSLYGLRSPGDSVSDLLHSIILDLIAGLRTPSEGAIIVPPHVRIGCVPVEPVFFGSMTLYENLTYGCGASVAPDLIWKLCAELGLPNFFFSDKGGSKRMSTVSFALSPAERQLVCLVRSIICVPELLIVHDLGHFTPELAALIGRVLYNYVDGVALSRLVKPRKPADDRLRRDDPATPATPAAPTAAGTPDTSTPAFWVTDVSKRTVIWQASDVVLHSAGVEKIVSIYASKVRISSLEGSDLGASKSGRARLASLTPMQASTRIVQGGRLAGRLEPMGSATPASASGIQPDVATPRPIGP
jgi:hypothetical protein